jgi:hypothetical protein
VGAEQLLDALAQLGIGAAGLVEEGGALLGVLVGGGEENGFDLLGYNGHGGLRG